MNDYPLTSEDKQKYAAEVEQYRQENVLTKQELAAIREKYKGFKPDAVPFFDEEEKKTESVIIFEYGEPTRYRDMNTGEEKKEFDSACLVSICCSIREFLEKISQDESYTEKQRDTFKYWECDLLKYLLPSYRHKTMIAYAQMHERYLYLKKELVDISKND